MMWLNRLLYSTSGEPTLLEELWEYLEGKYFSVDMGRYEHISIGSGSLVTLQKVVLGICVGIIIAAAMACYDKNKLGAFVRAIVKEQALWPDKAMTVYDLGFARNSAVKASLRSPNKLGKIVHCVEKEAYDAKVAEAREAYIAEHGNEEGFFMPQYRMDFDNDHFYIPDEEHYRAEVRFDKKGNGIAGLVLTAVLTVALAILLIKLTPVVLGMIDNLLK